MDPSVKRNRRNAEWTQCGRHDRLQRFVNQSGAALIREIVPQPVERHDDTLSRPYQVVDMGNAPEDPGNEAGQANLPNGDDRGFTTNSREVTIVPVFEWP